MAVVINEQTSEQVEQGLSNWDWFMILAVLTPIAMGLFRVLTQTGIETRYRVGSRGRVTKSRYFYAPDRKVRLGD